MLCLGAEGFLSEPPELTGYWLAVLQVVGRSHDRSSGFPAVRKVDCFAEGRAQRTIRSNLLLQI